jgi:hypothetical protein
LICHQGGEVKIVASSGWSLVGRVKWVGEEGEKREVGEEGSG